MKIVLQSVIFFYLYLTRKWTLISFCYMLTTYTLFSVSNNRTNESLACRRANPNLYVTLLFMPDSLSHLLTKRKLKWIFGTSHNFWDGIFCNMGGYWEEKVLFYSLLVYNLSRSYWNKMGLKGEKLTQIR